MLLAKKRAKKSGCIEIGVNGICKSIGKVVAVVYGIPIKL